MPSPAGKFGVRYGKRIRWKFASIEKVQKQRRVCPRCHMPYVKKVAKGIWYCRKCRTKFAGPSY